MRRACALLVGLAGCSQVLGIEELTGGGKTDASVAGDAVPGDGGPDAPIPAAIELRGVTQKLGLGAPPPFGGMMVEYLTAANVSVIATTSATDGTFTLTVPTEGRALDGYLRATAPGAAALVTLQYFVQPVGANTTDVAVLLVDSTTASQGASFCGAAFDPMLAIVAVLVRDAAQMGVAGAVLQTTPPPPPPNPYCSLDESGVPKPSNTSTKNGTVFAYGIPSGTVTVNGTAPNGGPLAQRTATVRGNSLTIVPYRVMPGP